MTEVEGRGEAIGNGTAAFHLPPECRGRDRRGAQAAQMLRDLEAGRPMEIEAIIGAVVELGERMSISPCRIPVACMLVSNSWRST